MIHGTLMAPDLEEQAQFHEWLRAAGGIARATPGSSSSGRPPPRDRQVMCFLSISVAVRVAQRVGGARL
jgi:hypothetical protein